MEEQIWNLLIQIAFMIFIALSIKAVFDGAAAYNSLLIEGVNDKTHPLGSIVRFRDDKTIYMIVGYQYKVLVSARTDPTVDRSHYVTCTYCAIPWHDYYRDKKIKPGMNEERFVSYRAPFNEMDVVEVIFAEKDIPCTTDKVKIIKKKPLEANTETSEYLPLGTIVKISGTDTLFMVIERNVNEIGEKYDYKAVPYSQGFKGKNIDSSSKAFQYFNRSDIEKIMRLGHTKTDNQ